jgi:PilZ domain
VSTQAPVDRKPRYPVSLAADLRGPGFATAGTTKNISVGGLCVEIDRMVPETTRLDVSLFIVEDEVESADGRRIALVATVQWSSEGDVGYLHGLKFVDMTPQQTAMIGNALRNLGLES